jgi:serine phosphatase RsbU (regulator of sigma subunit)
MSLRTRLIIAFLVLSIVPLTAVTSIWYISSVRTFERVAEREAAETAADIGRRMQMVTANVSRRMDRMFDEAVEASRGDGRGDVRERLTPMLGDSAALVERLEFQPTEMPPPPAPEPPAPPAAPRGRRGGGPRPPDFDGRPPAPRGPPPTIVVEIGRVIADAQRAAAAQIEAQRKAGNDPGAAAVDVRGLVAEALKQSGAAVDAGVAAVNDAIAREAVAAVSAQRPAMDVRGRRIRVPVMKDGKVVGTANATLNMERTMHSVLALARREQGEIPFGFDLQGQLYTQVPRGRETLASLGVSSADSVPADGSAKRVGDWLLVTQKDPSGLVFGIARPLDSSLREIRRLSWRNLSFGLLVIALACVGIVPISHRMTKHVSSLSAGVQQLAGGDFKARVPVQSSDEFGSLAASFNRMAEDLERHQALVVEQERLRRELELSRLIQTEMLPRKPLRLGAAEIIGLSIPAREVGGDFFNYFALPDGRLALLVGDVSGKGVSAALLMANVQATLRARLPLETDLARLADGLDREIDQNTPHSVYVTLFIAILDVERSQLRYVNAGHNPQFLLRRGGGIEALSSTGMPIALYAGQGYQEAVVDVGTGDLLFFYTDGLVETENEQGEMFGADRLQALLAAEHAEGIEVVLQRVDNAVRAFRGRAEPLDDATTMALRVDG